MLTGTVQAVVNRAGVAIIAIEERVETGAVIAGVNGA